MMMCETEERVRVRGEREKRDTRVETPYRRQTLSHLLAFAPLLCDVRSTRVGRVEGEASSEIGKKKKKMKDSTEDKTYEKKENSKKVKPTDRQRRNRNLSFTCDY